MKKALKYALGDVKDIEHWHPHGECRGLDYRNVMRGFIDILWDNFGYTAYEAHVEWHKLDHTIMDIFFDTYQVFEAYLSTCKQLGMDLELAIVDWQYMIVGRGHTDNLV